MASELDTAFLKEILKRGLVTDYQVDQARKTFQTMEKQGTAASVPQVFIQLRFLKPDQVRSILSEIQSGASTAGLPVVPPAGATPPSNPVILPAVADPPAAEAKSDTQHLEAPPLEAPPLEAPPLEAPPLEAPPLEAPPLIDAPLEAPPLIDAPLEAPPQVEAPPVVDVAPPVVATPVVDAPDLFASLQVDEVSVEGPSTESPASTEGFSAEQAPSQLKTKPVAAVEVPRFSNKKIIAVKIAKAAVPVVVFVALSYGIYAVIVAGNKKPEFTPKKRISLAGSSVPAEIPPSPESSKKEDKPEPDLSPAELTYFEFENRFLSFMDKSDFMGALGYLNDVPSSVTNSTEPEKLDALRQKVINKAKERFKNKQAKIRELEAVYEYGKALEIIKPLQALDIPEINTLVNAQIEKLETGINRSLQLSRAMAFQDIWMRTKPDWAQHEYTLVISTISNKMNQPKAEPISELLRDFIEQLKYGEEFMGFLVTKLTATIGRSIRAFGRVVKIVSVTRQKVNVKVGVKSGVRPLGKIEPENIVDLFKDDELTDHQKYGLAIYAFSAGETKIGEEWLAKLPEDYEGPEVLRAFIGLTRDTEAVTYLNRLQMAVKQFKPSKISLNGRKLLGEFKDTELVKAYEPWIREKLQLRN